MGGPIPWTAIDAYCRRMGIDGTQFDDMVYHLREMTAAADKWHEDHKPTATHKTPTAQDRPDKVG